MHSKQKGIQPAFAAFMAELTVCDSSNITLGSWILISFSTFLPHRAQLKLAGVIRQAGADAPKVVDCIWLVLSVSFSSSDAESQRLSKSSMFARMVTGLVEYIADPTAFTNSSWESSFFSMRSDVLRSTTRTLTACSSPLGEIR